MIKPQNHILLQNFCLFPHLLSGFETLVLLSPVFQCGVEGASGRTSIWALLSL